MAEVSHVLGLGIDARPAEQGADQFAQAATKVVGASGNIDRAAKQTQKEITDVGTQSRATGAAVSGMAQTVGTAAAGTTGSITRLSGGASNLTQAFAAATQASSKWVPELRGINEVVTPLFALIRANPIGFLVTGLVAAAGALGLFGRKAKEAAEDTKKLDDVFAGIRGTLDRGRAVLERATLTGDRSAELRQARADLEAMQKLSEDLRILRLTQETVPRAGLERVLGHEVLGGDETEIRRAIFLLEREIYVRRFRLEVLERQAKRQAEATEEEKKAAQAADEQRRALEALIATSKFESSLIGKTEEEKRRLRAARQAEAAATNLQGKEREELIAAYAAELERIDELIRQEASEKKSKEDLKKAEEDYRRTVEENIAAFNRAYEARKRALEDQYATLGKLAQDQLAMEQEAEKFYDRKDREEARKAQEEVRQSRQRSRELVDELRFEVSITGESNRERERSILLHRLEAEAKSFNADETSALREEVEKLLQEKATREDIAELSDQISGALVSGIERAIVEMENFGDIALSVLEEIRLAALRAFLIKPLQEQLFGVFQSLGSSIFGAASGSSGVSHSFAQWAYGARGMIVSQGNVVPFARGGHVTAGPEYFPLADGRMAVRGEAGDEIIAPARRNRRGELGLSLEGVAGNTFIFNIHGVQNVDEFRRNRRQLAAAAAGILRG